MESCISLREPLEDGVCYGDIEVLENVFLSMQRYMIVNTMQSNNGNNKHSCPYSSENAKLLKTT
jgi:hypothetical protein